MKKNIAEMLKKCETCQKYNRKKKGGCEFVVTKRPLEKVALDLIDMRVEMQSTSVGINYFTRIVALRVLDSKATRGVVKTVEKWVKEGAIEMIITDNGKEFCSEKLVVLQKIWDEAQESKREVPQKQWISGESYWDNQRGLDKRWSGCARRTSREDHKCA